MCRQRDAKVTVPLTPQPSSTQLEQQSEIGVFSCHQQLKRFVAFLVCCTPEGVISMWLFRLTPRQKLFGVDFRTTFSHWGHLVLSKKCPFFIFKWSSTIIPVLSKDSVIISKGSYSETTRRTLQWNQAYLHLVKKCAKTPLCTLADSQRLIEERQQNESTNGNVGKTEAKEREYIFFSF